MHGAFPLSNISFHFNHLRLLIRTIWQVRSEQSSFSRTHLKFFHLQHIVTTLVWCILNLSWKCYTSPTRSCLVHIVQFYASQLWSSERKLRDHKFWIFMFMNILRRKGRGSNCKCLQRHQSCPKWIFLMGIMVGNEAEYQSFCVTPGQPRPCPPDPWHTYSWRRLSLLMSSCLKRKQNISKMIQSTEVNSSSFSFLDIQLYLSARPPGFYCLSLILN